jgi:hypothetical protein
MNLSDYKSYIDKLCTMSNNYYVYDDHYIKNKYNIDSYNKFRKYFKKYHNDKLIFNSEKSENFFIKVMNLDSVYVAEKYKNYQAQIIVDFFIKRNQCYFNKCEELNGLNGSKNHLNNCRCKIKVKSVANLSINAFVYILIEQNMNISNRDNNINLKINNNLITNNKNVIKGDNPSDQVIQIVKLYNNESNKKIMDCIKKIEIAKNNLCLAQDNVQYQLTDTKPIKENDMSNNINEHKDIVPQQNYLIDSIHNTQHIPISDDKLNCYLNNNLLVEPVNLKKYDEQLISDSINLNETDNDSSYYKKKIFKKTCVLQTTIKNTINSPDLSDKKRFNELAQYAIQNSNNKDKFNINDIKTDTTNNSDSTNKLNLSPKLNEVVELNKSEELYSSSKSNNSNRFGNVIIKDNMVKIEKKQPGDLNNSSDILVSYNDNDYKNKKNTIISIINNHTKLSNINNIQVNNHAINLTEQVPTNERIVSSLSDDYQSNTSFEETKSKKDNQIVKVEVIEILNYLDSNFNYITSDDILIDKDKKMEICTFMVEVKYKIFEMFRQLDKIQNINSQYKSKISNNYEKIYQYVVQSSKIGSTGEMIEFNKNKQLIQNIIEDIIQI